MHSHILATLLLTIGLVGPVHSQPSTSAPYSAEQAWSRPTGVTPASSYRTGSGRPGPDYWQNRVEYTIKATLDTSSKTIHGDVTLKYTNNSPNALSNIWLSLDRSRHKSPQTRPTFSGTGSPPSFSVGTVAYAEETSQPSPTTNRVGDRMQIRLPSPVDAFGGTVRLTVSYTVSLSSDRLPLYQSTPSGPFYQVVNWYPRVESYDDVRGWAASSHQPSARPHGEYASYDYFLTVPASMIVAGSGTLMNPKDVLTSDQRRRLLSARRSKQKVAVISPDRAGTPGTRPETKGLLTWHFRMNGTRDVAWAASPSFVWNAVRVPRQGMNAAIAMSFYPPSSVGPESWNRSTYHVQRSIRLYSKTLRVYPWNNALNVAAPMGNVGSSGIAFCNPSASGRDLFSCTARTHAENWFPRIVSTDPGQHPWMTSGFTTFLSSLAHRTLYDGEFASAGPLNAPIDDATPNGPRSPLFSKSISIMTPPSLLSGRERAQMLSIKPAIGLLLLRDYILETEHFDYALKRYVKRWAYRQPTPEDFFRTVNDVTGENLWWFWKGWFLESWACDQSVEAVTYVDSTPAKGAKITLSLNAPLPMPLEAEITASNQKTTRIRLPVEIWQTGAQQTIQVDTDARIAKITLDPDDELPDARPSNDTWVPPAGE